jgi:hypothetical protein
MVISTEIPRYPEAGESPTMGAGVTVKRAEALWGIGSVVLAVIMCCPEGALGIVTSAWKVPWAVT